MIDYKSLEKEWINSIKDVYGLLKLASKDKMDAFMVVVANDPKANQ